MALKLYPLGIQTFEQICKEDKLYVDKTEYIYRMSHTSGKYFFLSRPRRFGKSLLVSTMQSYFEGKKELFKGLFSELNNIKNISMDEQYSGICGITIDELQTQMSEDIDVLAEKMALTHEQTVDRLKENYDGYHFTMPGPDVFNPFSLLNCFADGKMNDYWFGSGTPTYLLEMMRKYDFLPTNLGEEIDADKADFDAATETMTTIMPLLYQSGYLTIKAYDPDTELYTLGIPNKEIRIGLFRSLLPHYLGRFSQTGNTTIAKMSALINRK